MLYPVVMSIPVETFFLAPEAKDTLQSQIQQMIAQSILSGRFRRGEKLPSSRGLAAHLDVSRITVTLAYTELVANDYLTSRGRSGYFVSENAPVPPFYEPVPNAEDRVDWSRAIPRSFVRDGSFSKPLDWQTYRFPFIYGQTDPTLFDHTNWRQCALRALGAKDFAALTDDQFDRDDPMLVEFIARHTLPRRGIGARSEQILITLGAQNALWLTAQVLLGSRKTAVVEDPCYPPLRDVLQQRQCSVFRIPVDRDGLPPEQIPSRADVIFCTPSHQSPTTATMPARRRKALLDRAADINALIVEDDYEFELSFLKSPQPSLKSMDRDGRVIYAGSFSKSLFPGLRLGYLVGSEPFIREARALRASVLRHPPGLTQRTAAYFLSHGHYEAQIRRMSRALHARRAGLEKAIDQYGLTVAGRGAYGGSSLWMRAPAHVDTAQLADRLASKGVLIEPCAAFFAGDPKPDCYYRLGYSSIPESRIQEGVRRIAEELENWT